MKTSRKTFWESLSRLSRTRYGFHLIGDYIRQRETGLCPLCAVAKRLTGKRFLSPDYLAAARAMGLDIRFARTIAADADIATNDKVRKRLLEVCRVRA